MRRRLEHNALPSVEEIKLYQDGLLSPNRTHEIELLAEENPMLRDALEGYSTFPFFAAVPGVTMAVGQQAASGGLKGGVTLAKASTAWTLNGWLVGVGIAVATTAAITAVVVSSENMDTKTHAEPTTLVEAQSDNIANASELKGEEKQSPETILLNTLSDIKKENHQTEDFQHHQENNNSAAIEQEGKHEEIAPPIQELGNQVKIESIKENTLLLALGVERIQNYRVIDYTQYRRHLWQPLTLADSGDLDNEDNTESSALTYEQYLTQCLSAYSQQRYKAAEKGFLSILTQYKTDVNAQFYGAMSYYKHDQPVLALGLFNQVIENQISAFKEEALYYKAKCLKMLNYMEEANAIFLQIASESGQFKVLANKELMD